MPKIFKSGVESSFFKYISRVWDRLPQRDRDFIAEYWRGLIRSQADEYGAYLQAEAATGLLTINPYEVRKWRPIEIRRTPKFESLDDDGWASVYPTSQRNPYHAEYGILRFEHLYKQAQSLHRTFDLAVRSPAVFTAEADLRFSSPDFVDEVMLGFLDSTSGYQRSSAVALSFGRLAPIAEEGQFYGTRVQQTIGNFLVETAFPIVVSTPTAKAEVTGDHTAVLSGALFSGLLSDSSKTFVVVLYGSALGNNGVYKILATPEVNAVTVAETLVPEAGLDFEVFEVLVGGIQSQGFSTGNPVMNAVVEPQVLGGQTLTGGQAGIRVSGGRYNALRLHVDHLTLVESPVSPARFSVYQSSTNFPGSYVLVEKNLPLVRRSTDEYELKFSGLGVHFEPGTWLKIRPEDPSTSYTFLDIVSPLRALATSDHLLRSWYQVPAASTTPVGLKVVITGASGIYESLGMFRVELPAEFSFTAYHKYRLDVSGGQISVLIDGEPARINGQDSLPFDARDPRVFTAFGLFGLDGSRGIRAFCQNLKYTAFDIDPRIVELPALYNTYELPTNTLESGQDYSIAERGTLKFTSLDKIRDLDVVIAEYVSYALRRIESTYGMLVGVTGEDSPAMKNRTIGVWSALLDGPRLDSIRKGIHAYLGLPITLSDGFVTGGETSDTYLEIDGVRILYPVPVGSGVNPLTRRRYSVGDYIPAFSPIADGVVIRDYVVQLDWWYSDIRAQRIHELQKYHTFEVEIDDRLVAGVALAGVLNFLDQIRPLGDRYSVVIRTDISESLVVESNLSRTGLLQDNNDRIFVGDSSGPAEVCTPYVVSSLSGNTFSYGHFGGIDFDQAQALIPGFPGYDSLTSGGFGDPDPAFSQITDIVVGTSGDTSAPDVFTDLSQDFLTAGVRVGDYLKITTSGAQGLYTIVAVDSATQVRIHATTLRFTGTFLGVSYEIKRVVFAAVTPQAAFFIGGYAIREGAFLQMRADTLDEAIALVGIRATPSTGGPALVQPEELQAAMYFLNGDSRIPGVRAVIEQMGVDPRPYAAFDFPPRRVCFRTISTKGHNSSIQVVQTDGSIDLALAPGTYYGRITYPGTQHITSPDEPAVLPYRGTFMRSGTQQVPDAGEIDERAQALLIGAPRPDPGLQLPTTWYMHDGTTVRRDMLAVEEDGFLQYRTGLTPAELLTQPAQPYQLAVANGPEFGSFYADYVFPSQEYALAFPSIEILATGNLRVPGSLVSGVQAWVSTTGVMLPPDIVEDLDADFSRVRPGDNLQWSAGLYRVREVLSDTRLRLSIAVGQVLTGNGFRVPGQDLAVTYRIQVGDTVILSESGVNDGIRTVVSFLAQDTVLLSGPATLADPVAVLAVCTAALPPGGPVLPSYAIMAVPAIGDHVFVERLVLAPLVTSVDRTLYPVFEDDIFRIQDIWLPEGEFLVQRYRQDGSLESPAFATASAGVFSIQGRVVRDPSPYSLNPAVAFRRTHRVQKGYNIGGDDLRLLVDDCVFESI